MKTQAYLPLSFGPIQSAIPSILVALLAFSVGAFGLAHLAAIGSAPNLQQPAVTAPVAAPAPLCFDHSREWVASHGAQEGCPTDPMAYSPAAAFRVHH
jgi:hypothetical protein